MMGQSNMLGEGNIKGSSENTSLQHAVEVEGRYPYLWDKTTKQWAVADQVRNVFIMTSGNASFNQSVLQDNEWMQVPAKATKTMKKTSIGPELGIGFSLANYTALGHTMTLKSCIGNRALGWDILPPGSKSYTYNNLTYAGYGEAPRTRKPGDPFTTGGVASWYAGKQWDGDTTNAQHILDNLSDYYPGAEKYEVAGFFWWQGDKDRYTHYALTTHSLYTHHTLTIHSPYTHHTLTIHSPYTHHTLTIHSPYTHHTLTVHSPYTHHTLTIHYRYVHLG
jgi:hypothetical protein